MKDPKDLLKKKRNPKKELMFFPYRWVDRMKVFFVSGTYKVWRYCQEDIKKNYGGNIETDHHMICATA